MQKLRPFLTMLALTIALLSVGAGASRADYTVTGVVLNCNGAGVPNANVNVVILAGAIDCNSTQNTFLRVITTDATGHFSYVQSASGNVIRNYSWCVYTSTPPLAGELASDIVCCGDSPTGGSTWEQVSDGFTGTVNLLPINIVYSGGCTQGGDDGPPPKRH